MSEPSFSYGIGAINTKDQYLIEQDYSDVDLSSKKDVALSFGRTPRRFVLLFLMMVAYCLNQIAFFLNNLCPPDFLFYPALFAYLPLCIYSIRWIEEWGIQRTMIFALILQYLSFWCGRSLQQVMKKDTSLGASIAGEIFNSAAQVFMLNALTRFTGQWFGTRERVIATGLLLFSFQIGYFVTNWVLEPVAAEKANIFLDGYWFWMQIITVATLILIAVLFQRMPDEGASVSQGIYMKHKNKYKYKVEFEAMLQSYRIKAGLTFATICLVYAHCSPYVFYWYPFPALKDNYTKYVSIVDKTQPLLCAFGSLLGGVMLSTKFQFKLLILLTVCLNVIFTLLTQISVHIQNADMYFAGYLGQALVLGSLKLLIYEFITEIAYPIRASMAVGVLNCLVFTISLGINMLGDSAGEFINEDNWKIFGYGAVLQYIFIVCLSLGSIILIRIPFRYKRVEYDLANERKDS